MDTSLMRKFALCGLLLSAVTIGLLGPSGQAHAAQRTVVGELFSQDG